MGAKINQIIIMHLFNLKAFAVRGGFRFINN
ncbi:hypothetical protein Q787_05770 [Ornithobacterium rhinotracheale H06-030791]|nr:hypothetical protein Q785_06345 [Ornithobacterium rhinotracheale ORT-UMN 88]KGB67507.1 hypothetical protein Q787_05770 [Ornithobacterium rhinotracheale H06-030791]